MLDVPKILQVRAASFRPPFDDSIQVGKPKLLTVEGLDEVVADTFTHGVL